MFDLEGHIKKKGTSRHALFDAGLFLAIGSACVSNLRLTTSGPTVSFAGGSPFLYEFGIALVLLATILKLFKGIPLPSRRQKTALIGISLFYLPIFLNYFLRAHDIKIEFFGSGQLRLQLEAWLLGLAIALYPINLRSINRVAFIVVIMALINGIYVIAASLGLADPLYTKAWRVYGDIRHSGFFEMPASVGVLSAVAISLVLWFPFNRYLAIFCISVCGVAVIIADSRTGMIAIFIVFAVTVLSHYKWPWRFNAFVFLSLISICILIASVCWDYLLNVDVIRVESMRKSINLFWEYPFGIPWGEFPQYTRNRTIIIPHNWPALAFLYGGIFSFIAVALAHIWIFREWYTIRSINEKKGFLHKGLLLVLIALTTSSWFEQVLQQAFAVLLFVVAFGAISHLPVDTTKMNLQQQTPKKGI